MLFIVGTAKTHSSYIQQVNGEDCHLLHEYFWPATGKPEVDLLNMVSDGDWTISSQYFPWMFLSCVSNSFVTYGAVKVCFDWLID